MGQGEAVAGSFKKEHVQGVAKGSHETLEIVGGEYSQRAQGRPWGGLLIVWNNNDHGGCFRN